MKQKPKRSRSKIIFDVLNILGSSTDYRLVQTKLMQKANLTHGQLKILFPKLKRRRLVNIEKKWLGKKGSKGMEMKTIILTPYGMDFLSRYKAIKSDLDYLLNETLLV